MYLTTKDVVLQFDSSAKACLFGRYEMNHDLGPHMPNK